MKMALTTKGAAATTTKIIMKMKIKLTTQTVNPHL
jgi:hypothetical protein